MFCSSSTRIMLTQHFSNSIHYCAFYLQQSITNTMVDNVRFVVLLLACKCKLCELMEATPSHSHQQHPTGIQVLDEIKQTIKSQLTSGSVSLSNDDKWHLVERIIAVLPEVGNDDEAVAIVALKTLLELLLLWGIVGRLPKGVGIGANKRFISTEKPKTSLLLLHNASHNIRNSRAASYTGPFEHT